MDENHHWQVSLQKTHHKKKRNFFCKKNKEFKLLSKKIKKNISFPENKNNTVATVQTVMQVFFQEIQKNV